MSSRIQAEAELLTFVVAAALTGAVPVPGASVAITAENTAMVARLASTLGRRVSLTDVLAALGTVGAVNAVGRALFIDGARLMGWFTGPFGVAGISMLGAFTAGMQTWVLGQLTIAICESDGELTPAQAKRVVQDARNRFHEDVWGKVKEQL